MRQVNIFNTKKKYDIVYVDPPFTFDDKNTGGSQKSGSANKYQTMTLKQIFELPVKKIAKKNAFCFIWIPDSLIFAQKRKTPDYSEENFWFRHWKKPPALALFEEWGFTYKKEGFDWVKLTKTGEFHFGMGRSTRNGSEQLYFGLRGKPKIKSHSVRQVQLCKVEEHSRKPDLFRQKIIELCGDKSRIELFARQSCCGFDIWGKQTKNSNK
ncbi:MAG: MT-A70 family methyltransferase [Patescibacteria group bacterium]|nr:MT-A70 family methyltransferase [Patescibacteria group bacterium]